MTSAKLIQVRDLKKHYNKGRIKALDGVTVDVNRGDVMVVVGPSGSGKSTFLRSLNLLEVPTGGEIIFDGVDITRKRDENGKKIERGIRLSYGEVRMWFLEQFPEIENFDARKSLDKKMDEIRKARADRKAA